MSDSSPDGDVLTVIPSRRTLMTTLPVIGSFLVAGAVLLLGVLLAVRGETALGASVPLLLAGTIAVGTLLYSRYSTLRRLRPVFTLRDTVLTDHRGDDFELLDFDGIQTWVVEGTMTEPARFFFALIPRGETARVDPEEVTTGTSTRHQSCVPAALVPFTFDYPSQLRPRLHVFAAELQRRAPQLFLAHVGVM